MSWKRSEMSQPNYNMNKGTPLESLREFTTLGIGFQTANQEMSYRNLGNIGLELYQSTQLIIIIKLIQIVSCQTIVLHVMIQQKDSC